FGDQKYLDQWPSTYPGVVTARHKGVGVAPWNVGNYRFRLERDAVLVDDEALVFYHYSGFRPLRSWLFETGLGHWGHSMNRTLKHHVYLPYVRELRAAQSLVRQVNGNWPLGDSLHQGPERALSLTRLARTGSLLMSFGPIAL